VAAPVEFEAEELVTDDDELGGLEVVVRISGLVPVPLSVKSAADTAINNPTASAIARLAGLEIPARIAISPLESI